MTEEQLIEARALIEKYKGNVTEGKWEVDIASSGSGHYGISFICLDGSNGETMSEWLDTALMSDAPRLLNLLEVAIQSKDTIFLDFDGVALSDEFKTLIENEIKALALEIESPFEKMHVYRNWRGYEPR